MPLDDDEVALEKIVFSGAMGFQHFSFTRFALCTQTCFGIALMAFSLLAFGAGVFIGVLFWYAQPNPLLACEQMRYFALL